MPNEALKMGCDLSPICQGYPINVYPLKITHLSYTSLDKDSVAP